MNEILEPLHEFFFLFYKKNEESFSRLIMSDSLQPHGL